MDQNAEIRNNKLMEYPNRAKMQGLEKFRGRPITPEEVVELQASTIPPEVFQTFNELIATNMKFGKVNVLQKDVIAKVKVLLDRPFDSKWLYVEEIYRKAGWKVTYTRPDLNETFHAYFVFERPK